MIGTELRDGAIGLAEVLLVLKQRERGIEGGELRAVLSDVHFAWRDQERSWPIKNRRNNAKIVTRY